MPGSSVRSTRNAWICPFSPMKTFNGLPPSGTASARADGAARTAKATASSAADRERRDKAIPFRAERTPGDALRRGAPRQPSSVQLARDNRRDGGARGHPQLLEHVREMGV